MNEDAIVARLRALSGNPRGGLKLGIGDDCAIVRPRPGRDLLLKTDQLIEGVHFPPEAPARKIGERALARSLSDLAAMGGDPEYCLVALAVPRTTPERWLVSFFQGLLRLARKTGVQLAGGDLSHSACVYCAVMICGSVKRGKALRRDGAHPGDEIYVSGFLGKPWDRTIEPRLKLGQALVGRATSCMDLTDGLALDLHRLCKASGVAAELDRIPLARGSTLDRALHGGEDYELLFTLPASAPPPRGCVRIGTIRKGASGSISLNGSPLTAKGYDHFA
jgi:thiamine-monophosphate kinase